MSDAWAGLRHHTPARIAIGRAGGSLLTREVLDFAAAHAAARDAVHAVLDVDQLTAELRSIGLDVILLESAAADRQTHLQRPDLGRTLSGESLEKLTARTTDPTDLALILSDGLSAPAVQTHAVPLLQELLPMLRRNGFTTSPAVVVIHARVAVEDQIGEVIGAKAALILLGERPGLGSPDSLGAYLVFGPRAGRTDAERNCVSNVRPAGLGYRAAAETLHYLITESLRRKLSGVSLKDERGTILPPV